MSDQIVETEFKLEGDALDKIVDQTSEKAVEKVQAGIDEAVAKSVTEAVEASTKELLEKQLAQTEEIERKAVEAHVAKAAESDPVAKGLADGKFSEEIVKMSPAMRFYEQTRAIDPDNGNLARLKELNEYAVASQIKARAKAQEQGQDVVAKTGYGNSTTAADGAVLIPDAEFVTTVFDNLPSYGVAFQYADVRQTDRTSVRVITLDSGLAFYSTNEAAVKTGAKLAFAKTEVSLQKYAVIVPAADEFTDDAAIDYWNLVTRELSRAYAKLADELVFTNQSYGITNQSGVVTQTLGAGASALDWGDLLTLESKLEDDIDTSNYKWFLRKETWYALVQTKGTTNDHYIAGSLNAGWTANINTPTTPWGTPVVFTRVLPTINTVSANDAVAVFGDLRNTLLYNKRGMALKMLTEATVVDSEGSNLNLATQDASAMRAVVRLLHILPKGNKAKFGVLGTGTVS
jgi:HK97 family phage major capsid protein